MDHFYYQKYQKYIYLNFCSLRPQSWFLGTFCLSIDSPGPDDHFETKYAYFVPFVQWNIIRSPFFYIFGLRPRKFVFWGHIGTQYIALVLTVILSPNMPISVNYFYKKIILFSKMGNLPPFRGGGLKFTTYTFIYFSENSLPLF